MGRASIRSGCNAKRPVPSAFKRRHFAPRPTRHWPRPASTQRPHAGRPVAPIDQAVLNAQAAGQAPAAAGAHWPVRQAKRCPHGAREPAGRCPNWSNANGRISCGTPARSASAVVPMPPWCASTATRGSSKSKRACGSHSTCGGRWRGPVDLPPGKPGRQQPDRGITGRVHVRQKTGDGLQALRCAGRIQAAFKPASRSGSIQNLSMARHSACRSGRGTQVGTLSDPSIKGS